MPAEEEEMLADRTGKPKEVDMGANGHAKGEVVN